jgi:hypothetical protein
LHSHKNSHVLPSSVSGSPYVESEYSLSRILDRSAVCSAIFKACSRVIPSRLELLHPAANVAASKHPRIRLLQAISAPNYYVDDLNDAIYHNCTGVLPLINLDIHHIASDFEAYSVAE